MTIQSVSSVFPTDKGLPVDLAGADLRDRDLRNAQLQNANLQFADLRNCNLECANLRGANLEGALLCDANIACADMRRTNLQGANLSGAVFSTRLRPNCLNIAKYALGGESAYFDGLDAVDLEGANLRNAIFGPVFLVGRVSISAHMREIFLWSSEAGGALFHIGFKTFSPSLFRAVIAAQCIDPQKSAMLAALDFLESQIPNLSDRTSEGALKSHARLTAAFFQRLLKLLDDSDAKRRAAS